MVWEGPLFIYSAPYQGQFIHVPTSTPCPPPPPPERIDLLSDHVSFKTFFDHKRTVSPPIPMLFPVHRQGFFHRSSHVHDVMEFHLCFLREGDGGSERLNVFPKVTRLCQEQSLWLSPPPAVLKSGTSAVGGRPHAHDMESIHLPPKSRDL